MLKYYFFLQIKKLADLMKNVAILIPKVRLQNFKDSVEENNFDTPRNVKLILMLTKKNFLYKYPTFLYCSFYIIFTLNLKIFVLFLIDSWFLFVLLIAL